MLSKSMNKFDRTKLIRGAIVRALPSHINPTALSFLESFLVNFLESFPKRFLDIHPTSIRTDRSSCEEDAKIRSTGELLTLNCI